MVWGAERPARRFRRSHVGWGASPSVTIVQPLGLAPQPTSFEAGGTPAHATRMKQIVAVVKPYLAEKVLECLKRAPLEAVSVREVKGYGRQKSYLDQYAGSEYSLAFLPKVEINLWVDDARVEEIIRAIVEVARTGRMGDGKIFVLPATTYECVVDLEKVGVKAGK
jgi:nitrogen regulatory protein P-II 1